MDTRRSMSFRFASFVLLPLALFACSSSSSSGGTNGVGGGSDTPCGRYYNALTGYADRCGQVTGFEGSSNVVTRFESVCNTAASAPGATGFLAALDRCASKIGALGCDEESDCAIAGGTLDEGAACQESYQCKGYCKVENDASCGKCTTAVAIGAACQGSSECGEGNHCEFGTLDTGKCEADTKKAPGAACDNDSECTSGNACSTDHKCVATLPIGATCKESNECGASTAECKSGNCTAFPGEGAACEFSCAKGFACGSDQKCAKRDFVGVGASCDQVHLCKDSTCIGYSISSSSGNGTDSTLVQNPGKCQIPLADGAACTEKKAGEAETTSCDVFAKCTNGTCQIENPATCK